ncbi:hypothetical protein [Shouchella clausii]|uniref:hypothetical protein n=1 Tax=Shouchella clausii TaxID=79880 RepID=UPI0026F951EF|nr:hypothetical protein [Shouchella clausii]MDO7266504.1 hypothetical protein [Shouchella clausii]MDO7286581.1 hypothetical protein [Shouchella clausii]
MGVSRYSIQSTLMKSYVSGTPLQYDKALTTTTGTDGQLWLFSIGSDGLIYLYSKENGTDKGWNTRYLSGGLPEHSEAVFIEAIQDADGAPLLTAVVLKEQTYTVYMTKDFSDHTKDRWLFRGQYSGGTVSNIATGYGKQGQVFIVVTTQDKDRSSNHLINPNLTDTTWLWREVPAPLNSKHVIQTAIGHHNKLESINGVDGLLYALYQTSDNQTQLVITSLPDFHYYNHPVPLDFSPTSFALVTAPGSNSECWLGDTSVYYASPAVQLAKDAKTVKAGLRKIDGNPSKRPYKQILAARTNSGTDIWLLTDDGKLSRSYFDETSWTEPLLFQEQVGESALWVNRTTGENHLVVVDLDNQLYRYFQDVSTTRWHSEQILFESLGTIEEKDGYSTVIQLVDDKGAPAVNETIGVQASELVQLTINGKTYFATDRPGYIEANTDSLGNVMITQYVKSVAAAALRIAIPALNETIDIEPLAQVKQKLTGMSVDEWINAEMQTDQDGVTEPLLKGKSKQDIADTHQAVQRLLTMAQTLPSHKQGPFQTSSKHTPLANTLSLAHVEDGMHWGLDLTGKHPVYTENKGHIDQHFNPRAHLLNQTKDTAHILSDWFGDIWHAIKQGFITVTHFVFSKVKEGIELVINSAEKAYRVVLRYAEQLWDVIEYVFAEIDILLDDFVRWLGYLFKWKDILRTHEVIRTTVELGIKETVQKLDQGKAFVDRLIEHVQTNIADPALQENIGAFGSRTLTEQEYGQQLLFEAPEANWSMNYVMSGHLLKPGGNLPEVDTLAYDESWGAGLESVKQQFEQFGTELASQFESWSFATLFQKIISLLEDAVLEGVKLLADGLFTAAEQITQMVDDLLHIHWNVPLLTPLYEEIVAPGSKLTLIDFISLLTAIPATVLYKATTGDVPFEEETTTQLVNSQSYGDFLAKLGGKQPHLALDQEQSPVLLQAAAEPEVPIAARKASYAFGFIGGIASIIAGTASTTMSFTETTTIGCAVVFLSYSVGTATSVTTLSLDLAYKPYEKRLGFEMFYALFQIGFNLKDGLALGNQIKNKGIAKLAYELLLDLGETLLGAISCAFSIALAIWEGVDGEMTTSNGMKLTQNLAITISQILAFPASVISEPRVKKVIQGAQAFCNISPGVIDICRTAYDQEMEAIHTNR